MRVKFLVFVLKRKCSAEDNVLELSIVLFFISIIINDFKTNHTDAL